MRFRVSTVHPYFRALANNTASFKMPRRWSFPYPCGRVSTADKIPASRQMSASGMIIR